MDIYFACVILQGRDFWLLLLATAACVLVLEVNGHDLPLIFQCPYILVSVMNFCSNFYWLLCSLLVKLLDVWNCENGFFSTTILFKFWIPNLCFVWIWWWLVVFVLNRELFFLPDAFTFLLSWWLKLRILKVESEECLSFEQVPFSNGRGESFFISFGWKTWVLEFCC